MLLSAGLGPGAAAMATNRLAGSTVGNVSAQTAAMTPAGNILSQQAMVSPQASTGNAAQTPSQLQQAQAQAHSGMQPAASSSVLASQQTPGGLQQQPSQQPLDTNASQQSQQGQQRMFMGTNIPMPIEFAAEIDRQLNMYRAHQGHPGVDLTSVQHILEQSFFTRYLNMQAGRPPHQSNPIVGSSVTQSTESAMLMPSAGNNVSVISPTGVMQPQAQQQQQQQSQASQPAANSVPPVTPLPQAPVQQTNNVSAASATGFAPNAAQHMALVSMLNRQHIQILYNQLLQQIPQTFGNVGFDQFHQYLVSGQLIGIPPVHQMLILLVQRLQQQQLASSVTATSAANRPLNSVVPGLQPGMSPQLQHHQLQQQQQQRIQQQMGSLRPPNPVMSPSPGGQPPLNAASAALAAASAAAAAAAATANRGSASATPLQQQQQQQSGGQRGLKRKSVNSSPATSAAGAPSGQQGQQQGVNKSPRVMSPPMANKAAQNRSASVVNHPHTPQGVAQSPMVSPGVVATSTATTTAASVSSLAKKDGVNSNENHGTQSSNAPSVSPKVVKSEVDGSGKNDAGGVSRNTGLLSNTAPAAEDAKNRPAVSSSASGAENTTSSQQGASFAAAGLTSPVAQAGIASQQTPPVSGAGAIMTPTSQQQQQQQMLMSPSV
ncbi:hypothetical protein LPJ64_006378, partial [Coemansia asiatica]